MGGSVYWTVRSLPPVMNGFNHGIAIKKEDVNVTHQSLTNHVITKNVPVLEENVYCQEQHPNPVTNSPPVCLTATEPSSAPAGTNLARIPTARMTEWEGNAFMNF